VTGERRYPKAGDNRVCECGHAAGLHPVVTIDGERTRGGCILSHPHGPHTCEQYRPTRRA
jgi:hypothetical protein